MKNLPFICFCFISINGFGQTPKAIEDDLLKAFKKIEYSEAHVITNGYHSLTHANNVFQAKLKKYTVKYPFTFNQKFSSIKHLVIKISDDKMLKTYSWDNHSGGTMRFYTSVVQYKVGAKLFSENENKNGQLLTNIYTLKASKKKYYLIESFGVGMSSYFGMGIEAWSIENGRLNKKVKLFKTESGLHKYLGYAYWWDDKLKGDLIYNKSLNVLSIPLITKEERLTGKFITYKFTGQYFEKVN